jgi:hypothetical protein
MARTHFSRLAHAPGQGVVSVCRHGLIHLTWGNVTLRLERELFLRLGRLLDRALAIASPIPIYDGELSVGFDQTHFRITVEAIEWSLSTEAFLAFRAMVQEAVERLEALLASGRWDEPDEAEPLTLNPMDEPGEPRFSLN